MADPRKRIDWRAGLALAWAVWFGGLYAKMVFEQRFSANQRIKTVASTDRAHGSVGMAPNTSTPSGRTIAEAHRVP